MIAKNRRFRHISMGDSKNSFAAKYGSKISKRELEAIACRIAGLLESYNTGLGPFTSIALTFDDNVPQGLARIVDITKSHKSVYYSLPSTMVLESTDIEKLFIEAMFSTLRTMAEADADLDKLDACEKRALLLRNEVRFLYRYEDARRYTAKVFLSLLEPYPEFRQVYLQITDKETNDEVTKLIAELHHMEVNQLIAKIRINKGKIQITQAKAFMTEDFAQSYRARGFEYPFEIDIAKFLGEKSK